jgi:hypothetical protein
MTKYILPALSVVALAALYVIAFMVGRLNHPDLPAGHATGFAIGTLIYPLIGALLAILVKKTTMGAKAYDWRMFHIFLISFCFLSIFGKYAEYYDKTHGGVQKEQTEQTK